MRPGIVDSSGVRVFHGPAQGTEYGMVAIGPTTASPSPRAAGQPDQRVHAPRGLPHARGHAPHARARHRLRADHRARRDGARAPLISLQGWRFETELFYDLPVTLQEGDRLITRCTFNNPTSRPVTSGSRTSDEMCFNFAYVTPPPLARFCDEAVNDGPNVMYTPGMCAAPAAPRDLPLAQGRVIHDEPPTLTGGTLPSGRWVLSGVNFYVDTVMSAAGVINLTESAMSGRGQVWTESGRMVADLNASLVLVIGAGIRFSRDLPISFAGDVTAMGSTLAVRPTCPPDGSGAPSSLEFGLADEGRELTVGLRAQETANVRITPRYTFRRVD
jgi:hypothetical protein